MRIIQRQIELGPFEKGCHLVTKALLQGLPEIKAAESGLLHLFIQHTSASLSINENTDADVRSDLDMALDSLVPESLPFRHTDEGPDDMPAHVKAVLCGAAVSVPVQGGRLALGTWQGIYLNEHRQKGGRRKVFMSLFMS